MKDLRMSWKKLVLIYLAGVAVNCGYVAWLYQVRQFEAQIPVGAYEHNVWERSDVMTYVAPATIFLSEGSFLTRGRPDFLRTVGYPFFLAVNMLVFGEGWIPAVFYVQACLLAIVYPAFFVLAWMLFPRVARLPWVMLGYAFLSGTAMVYSLQVLSDGVCFAFLMAGLGSSLFGILRNRWSWILAGILVIGAAAQVRPVVGAVPFVLLFLGFFVLKQAGTPLTKTAVIRIAVCVSITFALSLLPSVRNYMNYGMFRPSGILPKAMIYLAQDVYRFKGRPKAVDDAVAGFSRIEETEGVRARVNAEERYSLDVMRQHPFLSAGFMVFNSLRNMFESHWQYTFFMFRSTWWQDDGYCVFKRRPLAVAFAVPWVVFYFVIYFSWLAFLFRVIRRREWLLIGACLFAILPLVASSFCGQGARMRLPAEWFLLLLGFSEILSRLDKVRSRAEVVTG